VRWDTVAGVAMDAGSPFDRIAAPAVRSGRRDEPPAALGPISTKTGAGAVALGSVLTVVGALMLIFTVRNPVFDPAPGLRFPVDEGTAAVEVAEPGNYAVYLQAPECLIEPVRFERVGERPVALGPITDERFVRFDDAGRCAQPVGTVPVPVAGLWTASLGTTTAALAEEDVDLVLFPADVSPSSIEWELAWVFVPAFVLGVALLVQGIRDHRRWRHSLEQLHDP
jgi:hypothetical protein